MSLMMPLIVNRQQIPLDETGYLCCLEDWSEAAAKQLASADGIVMTNAHWEIVHLLRQFYQQFDIAPNMRPLVNYVAQQLGKEKGNSIYLLTLFPPSPAKIACKIAGLPKPTGCL